MTSRASSQLPNFDSAASVRLARTGRSVTTFSIKLDHVAAADAVDRAPAPRRQHDAAENALGRLRAAGAGLAIGVELKELRNQGLDLIGS
jgi:hypothetical protein